jgi:ribose-phosphate pyrophosphokinase
MTVKLYGTSPRSIPQAEPIDYKSFTFSAGEVQVRLPDITEYENLVIESRFPSSQDLMEILLVYNAINEYTAYDGSVTLLLPYLPYSRQDRVCYPGEAFALSVLAKMLDTQRRAKDKVVTWDAHSDVSEKVFHGMNFTNVSVESLIERFLKIGVTFDPETVVIAPDKGAWMRASLAARAIGSREVIYTQKVRDPDDGSITAMTFGSDESNETDLQGKHILIADDICDGGRTFIELAKRVREFNPASITLYVTHGIFSRGLGVFTDEGSLLIDRILTSNLHPGVKLSAQTPEGLMVIDGKPEVVPFLITLN